jgi:hypothetical protein
MATKEMLYLKYIKKVTIGKKRFLRQENPVQPKLNSLVLSVHD